MSVVVLPLPGTASSSTALSVHCTACACCADLLEPETTSVGTEMNMRHTAASPVGMAVTVTACLTAAEGRTLTFRLTAEDTAGPIGEAAHTRAIVRAGRFMEKTNAKLTP